MTALSDLRDSMRETMRRDQVWPWLIERQPPNIDASKNILLYVEGLSVSFDGFKR